MSVIFDLKESGNSWACSVNEALESDCPEYIKSNGAIGSDLWWQNYESGSIPFEKKKGLVTFVGERIDFCNERYDCVEIDLDGKLVEYDRCGYWEHNEITKGVNVIIETFEICVKQKYGPTTFIFERLVKVI